MPGKGGKKSRVKCRKKAERNKKILSKKSNKRKERLKIIKERGNVCGIAPKSLEVTNVQLESSILEKSRKLNWLKRHLKKKTRGAVLNKGRYIGKIPYLTTYQPPI